MPIGSLHGKVTDSKTGEGLANASVTLIAVSDTIPDTTYPNGWYLIAVLPGKGYDVLFEKEKYYPVTVKNIDLPANGVVRLDAELQPYNGPTSVRRDRAPRIQPAEVKERAAPRTRRRVFRVPRRIKDPEDRAAFQAILEYCPETRAREIQKLLRTATIIKHDPSKKHLIREKPTESFPRSRGPQQRRTRP